MGNAAAAVAGATSRKIPEQVLSTIDVAPGLVRGGGSSLQEMILPSAFVGDLQIRKTMPEWGDILYLTMNGKVIVQGMNAMLQGLVKEKPEATTRIIDTLLQVLESLKVQRDEKTAYTMPREMLPSIVNSVLQEEGEVHEHSAGAESVMYMKAHGVHLKALLSDALGMLLVKKPPADTLLKRLSQYVEAAVHPVAVMYPSFPREQELSWYEAFAECSFRSPRHVALFYRNFLQYCETSITVQWDQQVIDLPGGATVTRYVGAGDWKMCSRMLAHQQAFSVCCSATRPVSAITFLPLLVMSWKGCRYVITLRPPAGQCVCGPEVTIDEHVPSCIAASIYTTLGKTSRLLHLPGILPTDVHITQSAAGRLYSLPIEGKGILPAGEPHLGFNVLATMHILRRELLEDLSSPVSPTSDMSHSEMQSGLAKAISGFCTRWCQSKHWDNSKQFLLTGDWTVVQHALKAKLHDAGINLCFLGPVAKHMGASSRGAPPYQTLLVEMAARGFKRLLISEWNRVLCSAAVDEKEKELMLVAGDMFTLLLSSSSETTRFWRGLLTDAVEAQHGFPSIFRELVPRVPLFYRASELTGCVFPSSEIHRILSPHTFHHLTCISIRPVMKAFVPISPFTAESSTERAFSRTVKLRPKSLSEAVRPPRYVDLHDAGTSSAADTCEAVRQYMR